jgi:hypothetical protein
VKRGKKSTVDKDEIQSQRLADTGRENNGLTRTELPMYIGSASGSIAKATVEQPERVPVSQYFTSQTATNSIEVQVVGSESYDMVMESYVILKKEGSTTNQQGICTGLKPWSQPRVMNVKSDENICISVRMAITDISWSVKPEQEQSVIFNINNTWSSSSISFGILSPKPSKVLGLCTIRPVHRGDSTEIPFYPPHIVKDLLLSPSVGDDRDLVCTKRQPIPTSMDAGAACLLDNEEDSVITAIITHGSTRWLPIGLKLGLSSDQIYSIVGTIAKDHDKLLAIIERAKIQHSGKHLVPKLLHACSAILPPIKGAVQNELLQKGEITFRITAITAYVITSVLCSTMLLVRAL